MLSRGLVFGLLLTLWAALITGGGHFNLPAMLFLSPVFFGLLLWPLWGFLSVRFNSIISKLVFVLTMAAHFIGLILYVRDPDNSDAYWFNIAMQDWTYIFFPASAFLLYFAAQVFLWTRFVRDTFIRHRLA
jgi:hypothetical protein